MDYCVAVGWNSLKRHCEYCRGMMSPYIEAVPIQGVQLGQDGRLRPEAWQESGVPYESEAALVPGIDHQSSEL